MTRRRIPYTYCVLRYVHDPAAGEALHRMRISHRLIEEDEAEDFAAETAAKIRQHP